MHTLVYFWSLGLGPFKCQKVEGEGACSEVPAPIIAGQILPRVSIQFCFATSFSTKLSGFGPFFHFWGSAMKVVTFPLQPPFLYSGFPLSYPSTYFCIFSVYKKLLKSPLCCWLLPLIVFILFFILLLSF